LLDFGQESVYERDASYGSFPLHFGGHDIVASFFCFWLHFALLSCI
jgi:hypothetical protein